MLEMHQPAPLRARAQFQSRDEIDLSLIGHVDAATAPTLAPLGNLVAQLGLRVVTIRLGGVDFVDIVGWQALGQLQERLMDAGIEVIVAPTPTEPMVPQELSAPLPQSPGVLVGGETATAIEPSVERLVSSTC